VDGSELDWLTTTVSYIPFTRGWADGWRALLKKLDSISAPRSLANAAPLAAASSAGVHCLCGRSQRVNFTP
jgi:hypothetical protein